MNPEQIELVQESWEKVEPIADQAADIFYTTLFELDPSVEPLFSSDDMTEQGKKLMEMIGAAVGMLHKLDELIAIHPSFTASGALCRHWS